MELSVHLRERKVVFGKIVTSILMHVANKYEKKELRISEAENGYNLKAYYMMGINLYIEKIGDKIP